MGTKRKLAAILSADAAGYSRLMADDEAATLRSLNDARVLFRKRLEAHGGRLVDTAGDSILAEFPSAVEAVECALELQQELARSNRQFAEHRRMVFRIGINLGDVIEQEDGTIYGDGVNVAARLQALAEPGSICISGTAFDQVEGKLPLAFKFIGEQSVKNIAKPVRSYRVLIGAEPGNARPTGASKRRRVAIGAAAIVAVLVAASIVWKVQKPPGDQATVSNDPALAMPTGPAIAVLPFTNMSGDAKQDYFADGITEEIISRLSRFPNLRVLARNSTFQFKGKAVDVREIGRQLGAAYVVEGSVRREASTVRVTAQLLDTKTGSHVWAETYDRNLDPKHLFAVQDDITAQMVTRIGDVHGAVNRADIQKIRTKSTASLDGYECVLLAYEYQRFLTPDKHARAKSCLLRTVERNPDYADAWANLAYTYADQYWAEYEGPPDPLVRAEDAANRAVELDPASQIAHFSLANVYYFKNNLDAFLIEAEKALALNPNNTDVLAAIGTRFVYSEMYSQRGLALLAKARALNPAHPAWYWFPLVYHQYRNADYQTALATARRAQIPGLFGSHIWMAAIYAQLGDQDRAKTELDTALSLNPAFGKDPLKYSRMWYKSEKGLQHRMDGLRKAGLEIPEEKR